MSSPNRIELGINIDHVVTVRQARRVAYPDPVHAALLAEQAGADNITLHLREDRRHIQDRDVHSLRPLLLTRMNLEMGLTQEMLDIAVKVRPHDCCLVPENRAEITTEGGLDVAADLERITAGVRTLGAAGIVESVFALLALREGVLPGTLNSVEPDPACGPQIRFDNAARPVRYAMNNSFGFGGNNCSLLFGAAA